MTEAHYFTRAQIKIILAAVAQFPTNTPEEDHDASIIVCSLQRFLEESS